MRHTERDKRTGRYVDGPKCEACGKSAGYNYCSLSTVNQDGIGLVVCANCAAESVEDEAAVHAKIVAREARAAKRAEKRAAR